MEQLGIKVTHLYGLTETYGPHTFCQMQEGWDTLDTEGRAQVMSRQGVPFHTAAYVRVVDDTMNDVPSDAATMGEVVMTGNNVMKGYFNDEDATAEAFRGGWFHSGDIGVMHPDGYIELRDRKKDIIISGGENISTIEVEHTIVKHPDVLECAVVSMPHDRWGEVPKAFVSLREGASPTEQDVIDFLSGASGALQVSEGDRVHRSPQDQHRQDPEVQVARKGMGRPRRSYLRRRPVDRVHRIGLGVTRARRVEARS